MKELKELRVNETNIQLKDNLVKGSILPEKISELTRTVTVQGNTVIEGPVYAHKLEIKQGDADFQGSVFTHLELYINSDAQGKIQFRKSVGSANSVVSRAKNCNPLFYSDINSKSVTLYNAFVAGSIYADEIILENCIVIGGVFATQQLELKHCIVGTFNSPTVTVSQEIGLLLPSAFSIEPIHSINESILFNYSLADLGALYKNLPQAANSGKILMDLQADEIKSDLTNDDVQKTIRSYTVVGKVLAADLLDMDKFQNHFLLTAASLGSQLLTNYDLGIDNEGNTATLSIENISQFFFDVLNGKTEVKMMDGKFDINQITGRFN